MIVQHYQPQSKKYLSSTDEKRLPMDAVSIGNPDFTSYSGDYFLSSDYSKWNAGGFYDVNSFEYLPDAVCESKNAKIALIPVPDFGPNQIPVIALDGAGNPTGWDVKSDYRSTDYWKVSDGSKVQFSIGEEPDSTMISEAPTSDLQYPTYKNGAWIEDLDRFKSTLKASVKAKFLSLRESYTGVVSALSSSWNSGKIYRDNIDEALDALANSLISALPQWKDSDNVFHGVTESDLNTIRNAISLDMYNEGIRLYQVKWQKDAEIDALTSVQSYNVESGWQ